MRFLMSSNGFNPSVSGYHPQFNAIWFLFSPLNRISFIIVCVYSCVQLFLLGNYISSHLSSFLMMAYVFGINNDQFWCSMYDHHVVNEIYIYMEQIYFEFNFRIHFGHMHALKGWRWSLLRCSRFPIHTQQYQL